MPDFEFNKSTERDECQLRVSFKGLIKVATDSRAIEWVAADVVKDADFFRFNGKWEKPDHNMDNPFSDDRGKSIGVYCCVKLSTGDYITEIAPWEQVLKAKAAAKYSGVWDKWPDEMAKKFIIKRASKQWPRTDQTDRLAQTVGVVNQYEGSDALIDKMDNVAGIILQALHHEEGPQADVIIECWEELTDEEKTTLNTAYSKGGYFQHKERYAIRDIISDYHREKREAAETAAAIESKESARGEVE